MNNGRLRNIGMRILGAGTCHVFAVRSLGVAALLAVEMMLGHRLGVSGYGAFAFILVVATVIAHLAPLGWLNASTRLVRTYIDRHDLPLLKGSLIAAHLTTALGVTIAGAMILAWSVMGAPAARHELAGLILPLVVALSAIELHRYVLRGQHAGVRGESLAILLLPAGVLCAVWAIGVDTVGQVVYTYVATCGILLVLSTVWIARGLPPGIGRTHADYRIRTWSGMAAAMLLGTAADELSARSAVLILGILETDKAVGLFQAAARLSLMTIFVLRAVTAVVAPQVAELYYAGRYEAVRALYLRACLLSACGGAPFLLIYGLRPEFALGLFGPGFEEGAPILRILAIGYFVSAATGPCATSLMMIGHERTYGGLAALGVCLNVLGILLLVPEFGALGAATVTAGVAILVNLGYALVLLMATRRKDSPRDHAYAAVATPVPPSDPH